jgi:hypothetical protein
MSLAKLRMNCNRKENGGSMKKLIVSLMLIAMSAAFAAESAPSSTVGYVKYDLLKPETKTTGLNMISLPFDEGYTTTQLLGNAITSCNQVSKYDAANQGWVASSKGAFGWSGVFNVFAGNAYHVNVTANSVHISDGALVTHPAYNLVKPATKTTGLNAIMHPLTKGGTAYDTTSELGANIHATYCNQISKYDEVNQGWVASSKGAFGWSGVFATEIAKGLLVNVTADVTWPSTKVYEESDAIAETAKEMPKGVSRNVMYLVKTAADAYYNFSAAPYDNITYRAWITARPTEVLNESSAGSFYETFGMGLSFVSVNVGNFTTPWAAGDFVTFRVIEEDGTINRMPVYDEWITITTALDGTVNDVYGGASTELGDPSLGPALLMNSPSSIEEGVLPAETKLHQNYPNPFNPTTTIKFDLAKESVVKLNVYNYNGQLVRSLVDGQMSAGYHAVNFDASSLSAGVYYYTMQTAGMTKTQKMVLVK